MMIDALTEGSHAQEDAAVARVRFDAVSLALLLAAGKQALSHGILRARHVALHRLPSPFVLLHFQVDVSRI